MRGGRGGWHLFVEENGPRPSASMIHSRECVSWPRKGAQVLSNGSLGTPGWCFQFYLYTETQTHGGWRTNARRPGFRDP